MTDYRAELQRLLGAVENDVIDTNDGLRFQAAVNRARTALAQPEPEGVADDEVPYSDPPHWCNTPDTELAWKAGKTLGWQISQRRYATPQPAPVPAPMSADTLAAIIREVDGAHRRLGAAALAVAILAHPAAINTQPAPVPVAERLPGPEDCDAEERCWWFSPADFSDDVSVPSWHLDASPGPGQVRFYGYTHWRPHNALPVPGAEVG
jgi:hypothetical protein